MTIESINPADGTPVSRFEPMNAEAVAERLDAIEGLPAWGPERRSAWWRSHEPATLEAI
jgi:hypothetical protein